MHVGSVLLASLVAVPLLLGPAPGGDSSRITLLCQTTGSNGEKTGARTVHIDLDKREVTDTQVYDNATPIVTNEAHARITRITDQVIAWKPYELVSHYGGNDVLTSFPFAEQGAEDVVDRYTLAITSPAHTSQCRLQTRQF